MEETEVTFLFQFGLIRDTITADLSKLNMRSLIQYACDFINTKVRLHFLFDITKY